MPQQRNTESDSGSTLIVAMMVMAIGAALSLVVTSLAVSQNRSSGVDRQRTVAVAAAESGIDATYATIQSSGMQLPCRWPTTGTASVRAYPDPTSVVATVTYYHTAGGAALPCSGGVLASGTPPTSALIVSTGSTPALAGRTTGGTRTMQASVNLVPISGAGFSKAIFGESTIIASNHSTVSGSTGSNANLYTNGNFVCSNNQNYHGGVIAPRGSISLAGCSVDGDVWARDGVSASNATVGGKVISSGSTVTLSGNTSVGGTVLAAGAISWPGCSAAKCFANQGSAAPPASYEQFPVLRGDAAALQSWTDAGYTVVYDNTHCTSDTAFGDWIAAHYAPMTGKTLVRTTCSVQFAKTKGINFSGDFALFASGIRGISTSNQVSFDSDGSTVRSLYLVVPFDASTRPCTAPGISTDNNFGSSAQVNLLVYSPCNVTFSNNGVPNQGQIYSGSTIQINNNFSLTFAQMPVFGVDPTSLPALSYNVDILYKREVRNP